MLFYINYKGEVHHENININGTFHFGRGNAS